MSQCIANFFSNPSLILRGRKIEYSIETDAQYYLKSLLFDLIDSAVLENK